MCILKCNDEKIVQIFKALSCKARFDIVIALTGNQCCSVGSIAAKLNMPQPNVSQHLAVLKNARIVDGYRNGAQICYRVVDKTTIKIIYALELDNKKISLEL